MLGAPARQTSIAAAGANLALGLWAAFSWQSGFWNFSVPVLEQPALNLAFGMQDGLSAVMIALSVLVTLAATLNARAPEGREKLYYSSILLIAAGAIGAFAATDLFFFFAFHELALIPTFLMIGILGRGDRQAIAWKITIYLARLDRPARRVGLAGQSRRHLRHPRWWRWPRMADWSLIPPHRNHRRVVDRRLWHAGLAFPDALVGRSSLCQRTGAGRHAACRRAEEIRSLRPDPRRHADRSRRHAGMAHAVLLFCC
jgi:hypothetical protein